MKTIEPTTSPMSLEDLSRLASEGNVLLRPLDVKQYLVGEVDDFQREVDLVARNPELTEFLEQRSHSRQTRSPDQARTIPWLD